MMQPLFVLFAGLLSFSACNSNATTTTKPAAALAQLPQNGTQTDVKTVRSTQVKTLLEKPQDLVILDVRTPEEYAGGHLKNAVLLNKYEAGFEAKLKGLDKSKRYLVYCAKGGRSADAVRMMEAFGFKNIYDATEGFETLKNSGLPVEK